MDLIENTPHMWLIAGVILVVFEFVLMPGVGFLFAGLGALLVGGLVETNLIHSQPIVWAVFFGSTIIFAIALWKPLSKFNLIKSDKEFSDMIGHKAILLKDAIPGEMTQVKWSGTIMNARLDKKVLYSVEKGAEIVILGVVGNTLVVAPE